MPNPMCSVSKETDKVWPSLSLQLGAPTSTNQRQSSITIRFQISGADAFQTQAFIARNPDIH